LPRRSFMQRRENGILNLTMIQSKYIRYAVYGICCIAVMFFMWKGIELYKNRGKVVLREDLPPAPASYDKLNGDQKILAEISDEQEKKHRDLFQETLSKIKEHPDSFLAWMEIGIIKNLFGDYKGAEDAWLYASVITPNQNRSWMNLADLYNNKLHNFEEAEKAYKKSIEKDPTFVAAYRDLATMYRNIPEKKNQAVSYLIEGYKQNPVDGVELIGLAAAWAELDGDKSLAIKYYEMLVEADPKNTVAQNEITRLKSGTQ
jgi:tetratricopeptide (TPR) repeat protein